MSSQTRNPLVTTYHFMDWHLQSGLVFKIAQDSALNVLKTLHILR